MKKKTSIILSMLLVFTIVVGGTIAYLTAKTGTVTNTFTAKTSCSKVIVWVSEKEDGKYNRAEKRKMVLNNTVTARKDGKFSRSYGKTEVTY